MVDLLSVFLTPQGWIELITLMFLEIALGIDNLVFIAITSARLPKQQQHIGRRLGLFAAMVMRCILLTCIVWIMSITVTLFTLPFGVVDGTTPVSVRSFIFLAGGIYLIYKGIIELREAIHGEEAEDGETPARRQISLPHAVGLIMVMDIVFSLDSVITAAGLSGHILIMCLAVILAVTIMMVFADAISDFINNNFEIKIVALLFVFLVGVLLLFEGFYIESIGGVPLNTVLYCMMVFGLIVAILIMRARHVAEKREHLKAATDVEEEQE